MLYTGFIANRLILMNIIYFRNYAPTINIQKEAARRGCQQVLWLYGEDKQMTEAGTMNFFVYWINKDGGEWIIVYYRLSKEIEGPIYRKLPQIL